MEELRKTVKAAAVVHKYLHETKELSAFTGWAYYIWEFLEKELTRREKEVHDEK